eukprot:355066-Chlamydomonas_euryale.AAC.9
MGLLPVIMTLTFTPGGSRAMLYHTCMQAMPCRVYIVPAFLYALPETSGLTDQQLQPISGAHNTCLRRVSGRRLDGTLYLTAQMCAAAGAPEFMQILKAASASSTTSGQDA